jgi:hypothetical protein
MLFPTLHSEKTEIADICNGRYIFRIRVAKYFIHSKKSLTERVKGPHMKRPEKIYLRPMIF